MALRFKIAAPLAALGVVLVAGCAARPPGDLLVPVGKAPSYTAKADMLVATTRGHGTEYDSDAFTADRSPKLNFAALRVSIPRDHTSGEIEWPDTGPPDAAKDFITTERASLDSSDFLNRIRANARRGGPEAHSVLVFVHGYNNLYQESVYRFAQIIHDGKFEGTNVLFAWPSRGKAQLYLADRESSAYSRDYLESALQQIASLPEVHEINILAHSMGNWLAVETLRQAKLKGHGDFNGKLGNVILASPDIDVDVFRTQLDVIGRLKRPITVLVSSDDKALGLSKFLAGGVSRVGVVSAQDPRVIAAAEKYNVRVVDLSRITSEDGLHHDKFAESGPVIAAIGRGLATDEVGKAGVVDAASALGKAIMNAPAAIAGEPVE
jgi:esterase/lipase superfamily enzyme